jgi:hypothetical protein
VKKYVFCGSSPVVAEVKFLSRTLDISTLLITCVTLFGNEIIIRKCTVEDDEIVFSNDFRYLDNTKIVIAWLDGADVDSGTAV